jgi:L-ascorbate metabolism protein UlaG (beta-lactamase superfamily)
MNSIMEETSHIQVTLLANEGILLQYNGVKILIDAFHVNKDEMFSGLSKHELDDLLEGEKPLFRDIGYVLFTHCHYDHFSADVTEAFLEKHHIKGLFMPDHPTRGFISLRDTARRQAEQTWLLNLPLGEKKKVPLMNEISLTVFRSVHAGKEYSDIENYCYLIDLGGRRIFIISDSEYNAPYFSNMLSGETIEAAFVNPLFLNIREGREVIIKALKPEKLVVYHIPFENKDTGFRRLVLRHVERYRDCLPPVFILWDELQTINFDSDGVLHGH